jgi:hypothetical protein
VERQVIVQNATSGAFGNATEDFIPHSGSGGQSHPGMGPVVTMVGGQSSLADSFQTAISGCSPVWWSFTTTQKLNLMPPHPLFWISGISPKVFPTSLNDTAGYMAPFYPTANTSLRPLRNKSLSDSSPLRNAWHMGKPRILTPSVSSHFGPTYAWMSVKQQWVKTHNPHTNAIKSSSQAQWKTSESPSSFLLVFKLNLFLLIGLLKLLSTPIRFSERYNGA